MTFPTLQFSFHGFADQVGSPLAVLKNGVHAVERAGGEPGRDCLVVDLLSAHDEIYLISPNLTSLPECDIIYFMDGR
jgi:hypothetical protein